MLPMVVEGRLPGLANGVLKSLGFFKKKQQQPKKLKSPKCRFSGF
jgi:hypothetical protein